MAKEYIPKNDLEQALIKEAAHLLRYYKRYMSVSDVVEELIGVVRRFPAADVTEVRHGRWIEKTAHDRRQYFECSNCGKQENKHTAIRGGFCWNCGVKMDKEETNELDKREG